MIIAHPDAGLAPAAELFAALADRARLRIVLTLAWGERSAGDLVGLTGLAPSTVSHHLRTLRLMRLVSSRREHKRVYYRLGGDVAGRGGEGLAFATRAGERIVLRHAPNPLRVALEAFRELLGPLGSFVIPETRDVGVGALGCDFPAVRRNSPRATPRVAAAPPPCR